MGISELGRFFGHTAGTRTSDTAAKSFDAVIAAAEPKAELATYGTARKGPALSMLRDALHLSTSVQQDMQVLKTAQFKPYTYDGHLMVEPSPLSQDLAPEVLSKALGHATTSEDAQLVFRTSENIRDFYTMHPWTDSIKDYELSKISEDAWAKSKAL